MNTIVVAIRQSLLPHSNCCCRFHISTPLTRRWDIHGFSGSFTSIYESLKPSAEEKSKQKQLIAILKKLVCNEWPNAKLYLYGSCVNSFGHPNSDIDVCLAIEDLYINKSEMLLALADYLQYNDFENVQAFKDIQAGVKPPGVWKTLLGAVSPVRSSNHFRNLQNYRVWWTGLGAQLARDVPFSAICWGTLELTCRKILKFTGDEVNAANILGANFAASLCAGSLAATTSCPLDVARTRRQIEKDPARQVKMTTRQTLMEIWRGGGCRGLFAGVTPRVARAGPSVGIVVSSYEVVKYALYCQHLTG